MKHLKLAVLAASLVSAGVVNAGTLQVTPLQYAAESALVGAALNAPVFSYSLAAPISTASSPTFTLAFKVDNALWNAAPLAANVGLVSPDGTKSLQATTVVLNGPTNDTITATFTVAAGGVAFAGAAGSATPGVGYVFPVGSTVSIGTTAAPPTIKVTSAMAAPALSCTASTVDTTLTATVKDALGNETETVAPLNVVKSNVYLRSSTGLAATAVAASGVSAETSKIDVTTPSLGTKFTAAALDANAAATVNNANEVLIGQIRLANAGSFFDAASAPLAAYTSADASLGTAGAAAGAAGNVSVTKFNLKVNGSFNTKGAVFLSTVPNCSTALRTDGTSAAPAAVVSGTAPAAAFVGTLTATSATFTNVVIDGVSTAFGAGTAATLTAAPAAGVSPDNRMVFVCYQRDVAASPTIVPTSQFTLDLAGSSIAHAATENGPTPICGTNLYNLQQNGVKIDVRNFVGKPTAAYTNGWISVLRVINTDESQSATVTAQVIKDDGTVLAGAPIVTALPARGYKMINSDAVEAALAGTASAGYADANGNNVRIRLTSPNASLRVQNYLYNPASKQFIEASSTQGDEQPGVAGAIVNTDAQK